MKAINHNCSRRWPSVFCWLLPRLVYCTVKIFLSYKINDTIIYRKELWTLKAKVSYWVCSVFESNRGLIEGNSWTNKEKRIDISTLSSYSWNNSMVTKYQSGGGKNDY